jgi:RelA/SpoT family (p)ppGpp synthetase
MIGYAPVTDDTEELFRQHLSYLNSTDRLQIERALDFARRGHGTQRRKSGELFFNHPVIVATYLAEFRFDADALMAALLHDIAEDTWVSIEEIEEQFGTAVARLVDGVTKLKEVTRGVAEKEQKLTEEELRDATLKKLFQAMTTDVRAVIIKLFDRLHNMRTIYALPPHKQAEKARETLSVFAPLANRLGMWEVKSELEGRSLQVLETRAYETIQSELDRLERYQEPIFETVREEIEACLDEAGIPIYDIRMSPENVYTVYSDLQKHGGGYREVDRMLRVTVLLEDWTDCYTALGHLHQLWRAVPLTFDDYISVRRENLYQSLHTTVVQANGQSLKIRLRTVDMDRIAQMGVLARWLYAGTPLWSPGLADRLEALFNTIDESISVEPQNPGLGVQSVVKDVFSDQIRVYTPDGEPIDLSEGSTPIDFAYKIHTELGNQCQAAYVNELPFPLNKPLKNGDQVRIVNSSRVQPKRAWLDEDLGFITSTYARTHARRWFRRLPKPEAIRQGQRLLEHELEMLGLQELDSLVIASMFGYRDATDLYYHIGRAELLPTVLSTRIMSDRWDEARRLPLDSVITGPDGSTYVIANADNRKLRLCATCDPRPRDGIIGFIRTDSTVTVHREGCHTLNNTREGVDFPPQRLRLGWGETGMREARLVLINVDVYDRPGLLNEITQLMRDKEVNIPHICTYRRKRARELGIEMELEVTTPRSLVRILHQIEALSNVKSVRMLPDRDPDAPHVLPPSFYRPE